MGPGYFKLVEMAIACEISGGQKVPPAKSGGQHSSGQAYNLVVFETARAKSPIRAFFCKINDTAEISSVALRAFL